MEQKDSKKEDNKAFSSSLRDTGCAHLLDYHRVHPAWLVFPSDWPVGTHLHDRPSADQYI